DGLDQLTRDLTTEVLDRPWQVVAYLRERHRWAADTTRPTQREVELFGAVDRVLDRAVAGLTAGDRRCRMVAMVGVLRGVAERAPRLSRPAADAFIADAITAVLRTTPVHAIDPGRLHPSDAVTWRLPPSPRERILAAALPLFRSRGFDGVGIGEIGDHAGVGASNVSRYFGSKEEVLVDIYDRVGARVEVAVDDAVASASDADHALQNLLEAYTEVAFGAADLVVVVGENRGALPRNEIARLRRRDRRVADIWRGVIAALRPELRPVETTTVVAGVIALVNSFPRHEPDALPAPSAVVPLARAFVGAA
ncbi:MAG TPA: TetR/AcrR family transcriptional regulator, partial [Microthrixaceae bacterium]|nr:TetR/AcrR family transcriptional regulator [Microthrixaceae bacterium]HNL49735.1 TetR/AcrR family transcriptional regulator [Microthrixaceae bacterium]